MVTMLRMHKCIARKNNFFLTGVLLFYSVLLCSCITPSNSDTERMVSLVNNSSLNKKGVSYLILSSDSLELIPGGLSPSFYKQYYGERVISIVDEDFVVVEYEGKSQKSISVIQKDDLKHNLVNPVNHTYYKGDTIFIQMDKQRNVIITDALL